MSLIDPGTDIDTPNKIIYKLNALSDRYSRDAAPRC